MTMTVKLRLYGQIQLRFIITQEEKIDSSGTLSGITLYYKQKLSSDLSMK